MNESERRSEVRITEHTTLFLELQSSSFDGSEDAKIVLCNSVDISANGLQISLDQAVPLGSILRLCADRGPSYEPMYLVGEVKWVEQRDDQYFIGFFLYDAENSHISAWQELIASKI